MANTYHFESGWNKESELPTRITGIVVGTEKILTDRN